MAHDDVPPAGWKPAPSPLRTRYAAGVSPDAPHPEHPRPQLVRPDWINLNGLWDFAVTPRAAAPPERFEGRILVPFAIESSLSGVCRALRPDERLWYRRRFRIPEPLRGRRWLLHFGAVDFEAEVWLNGRRLGMHRGGFDPFCFEITGAAHTSGENELRVAVWDPTDRGDQERGKQSLRPKWVWYTAVSGIWQTVWLEAVPQTFLSALRLVSHLDRECLEIAAGIDGDAGGEVLEAVASDAGARVAAASAPAGGPLLLRIPAPRTWSPEQPHLYDLELRLTRDGRLLDRVESYFGMRSFSVERDAAGRPRLCLNGEPRFFYGPLDQGYWPDGLYTPPDDQAVRDELALCKRLGFDTLRKHAKVESARWYHHCDRLGLVVWQDVPSGGRLGWRLPLSLAAMWSGLRVRDDRGLWRFGRGRAASRDEFRRATQALIASLGNAACIGMWVPFNEGWGQFESRAVAEWVRGLDPTRPVDAASGWFDQGAGDVCSRHVYPGPGKSFSDLEPAALRAPVLSEFGGIGLRLPGHLWHPRREFAYRRVGSEAQLTERYLALLRALEPLVAEGLSGAVYTQLTDVEIETNGLLTYDRERTKLDASRVAAAHARLREAARSGD